jgi:hypothetical protein
LKTAATNACAPTRVEKPSVIKIDTNAIRFIRSAEHLRTDHKSNPHPKAQAP